MLSIIIAVSRRCQGKSQYDPGIINSVNDGIHTYLEYLSVVESIGEFSIDEGELNSTTVDRCPQWDMCDPDDEIPFQFVNNGWCIDDVHGGSLPMDLVREARQDEINGFSERRVYTIRPRREAIEKGAKVIGVRWVDSAKNGGVRSRLVCQDFKRGKGQCDEMFAPTPPLLASRWLCSKMASQSKTGLLDGRLMVLDFSKAFLYGDVDRGIYIYIYRTA